MSNIEVVPAIIPKSLQDIHDHAGRVASFVHRVQIDVMDGDFAQSVSWPFNNEVESEAEDSDSDNEVDYQDENFETHIKEFKGLIARVIQHEYDHIEGILFTDRISNFKKRLIRGKLNNISKGKVDVDYRMRFPDIKKKKIML